MRIVRRVRPVFALPSKPSAPTAPPYQRRALRSCASMNSSAARFGAPVTVTAQACERKASSASHSGQQRALDVVDGVDEPRVELDRAPREHAHAARLADAALVVAVDVGAHGELGLLLRVGEEAADLLGVAERVGAARDRARDRARLDAAAAHAHVHLGRRADQVLARAEAREEAVRRGVARAQALEDARTAAPRTGSENVCPGTTSKRSPARKRSVAARRRPRTRPARGRRRARGSRGARRGRARDGGLARRGPRSSRRPPRSRSAAAPRTPCGGRRRRSRRAGRARGRAGPRRAAGGAGSARTAKTRS